MKRNRIYWKIWGIKLSLILVPAGLLMLLFQFLPGLAREYSRKQFSGEVHEIESAHFRVLHQSAPESAETIRALVEGFHDAFYASFSPYMNLLPLRRKPEIFIFKDQNDFLRYHRGKTGSDLPNNSAYYNPMDNRVILYHSSEVKRTLYHELTHLIMDLGVSTPGTQWTPWFSEGIAVYCELSNVSSGRLVPSPRDETISKRFREAFSPGEKISPGLFLRAPRKEFEGEENSTYYYGSYLLVYFLLHGEQGKYRERFFRYFQEEQKEGPCPIPVFWDVMGNSPEGLTREFNHFLGTGMKQ